MRLTPGRIFRTLLSIQRYLDKYKYKIKELEAANGRIEELESSIEQLKSAVAQLKLALDINPPRTDDPILVGRTIVPYLSGGLGNQLFQLACAYALSRRLGYLFRINYDMYATLGQGQYPTKYRNSFFRNIEVTDIRPTADYTYWHHKYQEIFQIPNSHVRLEGYFQSSKYFGPFKEEVRHLFILPEAELKLAKEFLQKDSRHVVGVHIRLGDYATHPAMQTCDRNYYLKAAKHFPPDSRFVICSDQPDLARKLFNSNDSIQIEVFNGGSEAGDLVFLACCKQLILSNSTFSFWAYYLGTNKSKVIAPKQWFNRDVEENNHSDIYESDWITV